MKGITHWFRSFFRLRNPYLFVSLFISLLILVFWVKSQSYEITAFTNLIPGTATFDNIDVAKRLSVFYQSLFLFTGVFLIFITIFYFIDLKFRRVKFLFVPWNILSLSGIAFLFFDVINSPQTNSLVFLFSAGFTLLLFQIFRYNFRFRLISIQKNYFIWLSALNLSFCFFIRELLPQISGLKIFELNVLYPIVFTVLIIILAFLSRFTRLTFKQLFSVTLPFFTLPMIPALSNEMYLILNQRNIHIGSPVAFYFILIIICLLISVRLYLRSQKAGKINIKKLIRNFVFPAVLFGIVVFIEYKPFINQPNDLFELANTANAVMRIFDFYQFPIIQTLSSHMLSDIGSNLVYTFFNGYNGTVDFLIYDFVVNAFFILLLYFFLVRIFKNEVLAFLTILFFPFVSLAMLGFHSLAFVSIFLLYRLYEKYSFKRFLLLILWTVFLIGWKMDVGVSALAATLILTALYIINHYHKQILFDLGKIVLMIGGGIVIILTAISLIWKIDITGNLGQAIEYFGANQAHGYPFLAYNYDRLFRFHYFIFPVASVLIFLFLLFKKPNDTEKKNSFLVLSLLFLIVYYFSNAQRGLVRHCMAEGSELYMTSFFYLIASLFIYYLASRNKYAVCIFFISFVFLVNSFKFPNSDEYRNNFENLNKAFKKEVHSEKFDYKVCRVIGSGEFAQSRYLDFRDFMDTYFKDDATFIDFSNSPMLYFYTKRNVPSYFNQYMQNTVTEELQLSNIAYLEQQQVPIVVFSSVPESWWDHTDDVPNTIRYQKIAGYIYENYKPLTILNGFYIWLKKGEVIAFPDSLKVDSAFVALPKEYNLRQYPHLLAKSENLKSGLKPEKKWTDPKTAVSLTNLKLSRKSDNYLMLTISKADESKAELTVKYSVGGTDLGTFKCTLLPSAKAESYLFPLSSQYNWIHENADSIKISVDPPCKFELKEVQLLSKK